MNIRPFIEKDFPEILNIYAQSKLDELVYESNKFELLPLEKDKKRLAEFREAEAYVYDDNGIIGYGALCGSEIRALFVHPDGRRKGLGGHLLRYLLSKIKGSASLFVTKTNTPAKSLYKKYGFYVVEEFKTTYNGCLSLQIKWYGLNAMTNKFLKLAATTLSKSRPLGSRV